MRKSIGCFLSAALLIGTLTACGDQTDKAITSSDSSGQAQQQSTDTSSEPEGYGEGIYVMRIGHAQSTDSPRHRSLVTFKEDVEKATDGKIIIEIYPDEELGNETEMTANVSAGELEAVRGGDLDYVPKSQLLSLPMLADNIEQARELCYSSFMTDMLSSAETDYNMKVLAVGDDSGLRQITNNVHRITSPADMKGLKIRAPQIVATVNFLEECGASASVVPFTELYESLKQGSVDGQENPLAVIDSSRFYEVQKYCTIIDYQFFPELMYVNLTWWNTLPENYQKILTKAARNMMDENARITDQENEQYMKHIQANGCEIYTLTQEERAAFQTYAERSWQKYIDGGYATKEDLVNMLKVIGKSVDW